MTGLISASLSARPIHLSNAAPDLILMGSGVYIHDMTPDMARQWIQVLEKITKEEN